MARIDISKLRAPVFTARQLQLLTQTAQIVGMILIAKGVITQGDWELYFGGAMSLAALLFGWADAGANDKSTAAIQATLGAAPDSKPGPVTLGKALAEVNK